MTYVVFDFDGTLADSAGVAVKLYNEIAEKHGFGMLTPDNLEEMRTLTVLERCRKLKVAPYKLPWLVVQVTRSYRGAVRSIEFNPGIPELLKTLRERGLKIAIVSTNAEENIRAFLQRHGAEGWVDEVFCSSSIFGKAKLLKDLMKKTGLRREQLVYVGDEHRDVEACRQVGVQVIAVRWGVDADNRLKEAGPDFIADTPADVAEWVARWSASRSEAR